MLDVTHQITTTRRRVGTRVLAAGEARVVTIGRTSSKATLAAPYSGATRRTASPPPGSTAGT